MAGTLKQQLLSDMFNARTHYLNLLIAANRDSSGNTAPALEKRIVNECEKIDELFVELDEEIKLANSKIVRR